MNAEVGNDANVSVYNMGGMLVAKGKGLQTLQTLAKGAYIVKVQTANGTKTMKIAR